MACGHHGAFLCCGGVIGATVRHFTWSPARSKHRPQTLDLIPPKLPSGVAKFCSKSGVLQDRPQSVALGAATNWLLAGLRGHSSSVEIPTGQVGWNKSRAQWHAVPDGQQQKKYRNSTCLLVANWVKKGPEFSPSYPKQHPSGEC